MTKKYPKKFEELEEQEGKRYYRKRGLRKRYDVCEKTIDRWRELKPTPRIPEPDFYQGRIPFWSDDRLDEADRRAAELGPPQSSAPVNPNDPNDPNKPWNWGDDKPTAKRGRGRPPKKSKRAEANA